MNQAISFEMYKNIFDSYADRYDKNDGRVELKIIHTNAVTAIMKRICQMRKLPEHTQALALLCAQFHDIGRFEQLKQYDTFLDHMSVNHAVLSCQILQEKGILDALCEKDRQKILTAIANHNKLEIDPTVIKAAEPHDGSRPSFDALECLELCRLLRDADKCDIFRVFATDNMVDVVGVPDEEVARGTVSPAVLLAVRGHRCVDKRIRRTYLDYWISFLGYFFDLNYAESMSIAREQGYYRVPFERVSFSDPAAKEQVKEAFAIVEHYIDHFSEKERLRADSLNGNEKNNDLDDQTVVPDALRHFFREHPSIALAFSGGTDSAYLLYAASSCGCDVHAYYVSTQFQPAFELDDARQLAGQLGANMTVIPCDILDTEAVRKNPTDRCYFCKNAIFRHILDAAAKDGYQEIMDGTNASDDAGDRPGMRALRELRVFSPLRLCGITKKELRQYSKNAGLFTWDKPAYACLATRIPSGIEIEASVLARIERAEHTLTEMGFQDFRVRVFPDLSSPIASGTPEPDKAVQEPGYSNLSSARYAAKLQLTAVQLPLLMERREAVTELLKQDFSSVLLDLDARGSSV